MDGALSLSSQYDVLLRGNPFCDLTFRFKDLDTLPTLGQEVFADDLTISAGGAFNISAALTRLGLRVGLKLQAGTDLFCRFFLERMRECGLSLELVSRIDQPRPVMTVGISLPHDRIFVSYMPDPATLPPQAAITVDDLERYRPRAIFTLGTIDLEVCRVARRLGILICVDTTWAPDHLQSAFLRELIQEADVFTPNLQEALEITGARSAPEALDMLRGWCSCIVIKCGVDGCLAWRDGERYAVPAIPVTAIETTGAGDNFNAGLLYGLLQDYPFETCLRCAVIAGGLSTLVPGGSGAAYTAADIEDWLGRT